jgi:hypothetical protein
VTEAALAVAAQIKDALPHGSYLAISEIAGTDPALNAALHEYRHSGAAPYHAWRPEQIARFFGSLELVHPGVVPIPEWRPGWSSKKGGSRHGHVYRYALAPSCRCLAVGWARMRFPAGRRAG